MFASKTIRRVRYFFLKTGCLIHKISQKLPRHQPMGKAILPERDMEKQKARHFQTGFRFSIDIFISLLLAS